MSEYTGSIELDRSGAEPVVHVTHPSGTFTLDQLRMYGSYLVTVAGEAARGPSEPEVDELAAVIDASEARWLPYGEAVRALARSILNAGYKRENAAREGTG